MNPIPTPVRDDWEKEFDEKWFQTEGVSETLNQHRWMMKDYVRSLLSSHTASVWKRAIEEAREAIDNTPNLENLPNLSELSPEGSFKHGYAFGIDVAEDAVDALLSASREDGVK